jgi:tryptophan synthase alpha chain
MRPRDTIAAAIEAARKEGQPALIGYLTAGFPTRSQFLHNLAEVAAECDVVEIGVPFSDPMADGTTIQRASFAALADGVTLPWILEELKIFGEQRTVGGGMARAAPVILMSYLNPLLAYGLKKLPRAAREAGVAGFIVPDLPYEESAALRAALDEEGLALVQMVTPVTPEGRLEMLCGSSQGFVYAVTMTGTTGKSAEVPDTVLAYMDRVRRASTVPVCAGFGIRSHAQVARFAPHVDGVVVGSALVETLERQGDVRAFLKSLRQG